MNAALITCQTIPKVNMVLPVAYFCDLSPVSVSTAPNSARGPGKRALSRMYAVTKSFPLVTPPRL